MGTVFQEVRPGAGFKTGDGVEEKLEGLPQNDSSRRWNLSKVIFVCSVGCVNSG